MFQTSAVQLAAKCYRPLLSSPFWGPEVFVLLTVHLFSLTQGSEVRLMNFMKLLCT